MDFNSLCKNPKNTFKKDEWSDNQAGELVHCYTCTFLNIQYFLKATINIMHYRLVYCPNNLTNKNIRILANSKTNGLDLKQSLKMQNNQVIPNMYKGIKHTGSKPFVNANDYSENDYQK